MGCIWGKEHGQAGGSETRIGNIYGTPLSYDRRVEEEKSELKICRDNDTTDNNITPSKRSSSNISTVETFGIALSNKYFFQGIRQGQNQLFSIVADASPSTLKSSGRWQDSQHIIEVLSSHISRNSSIGFSLYFFYNDFKKYERVKTAEEVSLCFDWYKRRREQNFSSDSSPSMLYYLPILLPSTH